MKVICPKCQFENQVDATPTSPKTRVVCARCATLIDARLDEGANGSGRTARSPFMANPAINQPSRDLYATRTEPDFDEVLDIPCSPQADYQASESLPAFDDVLSTSPYDFAPPERVTKPMAEEARAAAPAPVEQNGHTPAPDPQLMGWPVLPEDSFEFRRTPGDSRFGRGRKMLTGFALVLLVFGGLFFLVWLVLGPMFKRPSEPSNNQANTGATIRPAPANTQTVKPAVTPAANQPENSKPAVAPSTAPTVDAKVTGTPEAKAPDKPGNETAATGKAASSSPKPEMKSSASPAVSPTPKIERKPLEVPVGSTGQSVKPGEGSLTIQVGSYNDLAQANERAASLRSAGVEARVVKAEIPNKGTWHRVQAGRFTSREEADRYGKQLQAKGAVKDFIVTGFQAQ